MVHLVMSGVLQVLVHERIGCPLNPMRLAMWNLPPSPPVTPGQRRLMGYVPAPPPTLPTVASLPLHPSFSLREKAPARRLDRLKLDCSALDEKDTQQKGSKGRYSPEQTFSAASDSSEGLMGLPQGGTPGSSSPAMLSSGERGLDYPYRTEGRPDVFRVTSTGQNLSSILPETFFQPSAAAMDPQARIGFSAHSSGLLPHSSSAKPRLPQPTGKADGPSTAGLSERRSHKELVVGVLGPGEFVGEMGIFVPALPRDLVVRTATRAEVALIPHDVFMEALQGALAADALRIMYAIGHQLSRRLMLIEHRASAMAFLDVGDRVLRTVMELVYGSDALSHPDGTQIRVSRQELARLSGCSREMAGRALKDLEDRHILSADGKTIVVFGSRG